MPPAPAHGARTRDMAKKKKRKRARSQRHKVRVEFRRNRAQRTRQRALPTHLHADADEDHLATPQVESVAAKGALSRRRTVIDDDARHADALEGTVVAVRGLVADVVTPDGQHVACTVRRVLRTRRIKERHPVVVGDRVLFRPLPVQGESAPEGVIEQVRDRRTRLRRANPKRTQLIAANVDQVIVVASADLPPLKPALVDRYLISAHAGEMAAVVCINKMDLDTDGRAAAILERYRRIGYPTLGTSALTGQGVDALRDHLRGKASVLAGQSGVGKSSLLNAVQPDLALRVDQVSDTTEKGRHTTSTAQLLALAIGGYVVDTPGIRSFELAMVPLPEIETHFVEFQPLLAHCRFSNCTHIHEDGCAVLAAVDRGDVHPDRYASYVRIFKERSGLVPVEIFQDDTGTRRPSGE
jgi:ribosome biogenesis GTPase